MFNRDNDYLVICNTMGEASELMNTFIAKLHQSGEVREVYRNTRTVYLIDGSRYRFTSSSNTRNLEKLKQGFHGKMLYSKTFEVMIKSYHPSAINSGFRRSRLYIAKVYENIIEFFRSIFKKNINTEE